MELLSIADMKWLAGYQGTPCVSMYMPAHRHHPDSDQDPIRFGNLLRDVETDLAARSMRRNDIAGLLAPAYALLQDSHFWRHQQDGLAVFLSADQFRAYRLPFTVAELATVSVRFHLSPLLPLFTNNGHFYILALSQNAARLFEGTRFSVGEVGLPDGAPVSLRDVIGDKEDQGLQAHAVGSPGSGKSVVFGQGGQAGTERKQVERYLNELDKALLPQLRANEAPLVIAGDVQLLPIYREVTNYSQVVDDGPRGNPEELKPEQLHAEAWPFVEGIFRSALETTLERYGALAGTGRTGSAVEETVQSALEGRVDSLVIPLDTKVWGEWQADEHRVTRHDQQLPDSLELIGFAAAQTVLNGGSVFAVDVSEMPENAEVAAVYRY